MDTKADPKQTANQEEQVNAGFEYGMLVHMIWVTGNRGDIGSKLSSSFKDFGYIRISDLNNQAIKLSEGDTLIHLAGVVGESMVRKNISWSYHINVEITEALAIAAHERGLSRFIFASTSHVYEKTSSILTEDSPVGPRSLYAEQKLEAELALLKIFKGSNTNLVIARIFSVLGLDMKEHTLGGKLTRSLRGSLETIPCCDDLRSFLTPNNYASLIERIAKQQTSIPQVLNICGDKAMTVRDACLSLQMTSGLIHVGLGFERGHSTSPFIVGDNKLLKRTIKVDSIEFSNQII